MHVQHWLPLPIQVTPTTQGRASKGPQIQIKIKHAVRGLGPRPMTPACCSDIPSDCSLVLWCYTQPLHSHYSLCTWGPSGANSSTS